MKKPIKNFVAAVLSISMLALFSGCGSSETEESSTAATSEETTVTTVATQPPTQTVQTDAVEPLDMDDTLFIGDSRTMGLMEYSGLESDFFASVGMSVYNIDDDSISVPNIGKVTLDELLSNKSYGKIYLMIGINELGYDIDQTAELYGELVDSIRQKQPDAKLFIQANLHVTKAKSDDHAYIKNTNINKLNDKIAKFADGKSVLYLDVNPVYDDADGALAENYTSDGVHLFAKYYIEWGDWIARQSAIVLKEG